MLLKQARSRKNVKSDNIEILFENIYRNYDGTSSPHCLIELDKKQLNRVQKYSIHLQNISLKNGLSYESVKHGKTVRCHSCIECMARKILFWSFISYTCPRWTV